MCLTKNEINKFCGDIGNAES